MSSYTGSHRPPRSRLSRFLKVAMLVAAVGALVGGTGGFVAYRQLNANITAVDLPAVVEASRPPVVAKTVTLPDGESGALNVLLLGSDTRDGAAGKKVGGESAGLSDTAMLVHVAADRTWAKAVSIPRDTMVDRPACERRDGAGTDEGGLSMFNAAYAVGGPACTVATVEAVTDVRVDHFAVIDFAGFANMVDAVGGVEICVPKTVNDKVGNIRLKKGRYVADGDTALDYVRERHVLSANADLGRVKRQQAFLAALGEKVTSAGTLTNPARLYALLDAVTSSLTTDRGWASLSALAGMARELDKVGIGRVEFATAPVRPYPQDANRVEFARSAQTVWESFRTDTRPEDLPGATPASGATASPSPSPTPTRTAAPGTRTVEQVENGLCGS
jgi:LCP family protein required for cell wall assembly